MALTDSLPTGDSGGLTVADERLILSGLVAKNADGTPRVGVFGTGVLVTGRASMGYDVAPFKAATSRTGTGVELLANDSVTTVATTAAPGANSRIDVIWVRPQFTANADAGNVPVFGVTQGVAQAVPTKPAIPAGALELATATILSTTTTTGTVVITQTAPYTAAAGGVVPVRNATELAAYVAATGQYAHNLATGALYLRGASAWGSTSPGIGMRRTATGGTVSTTYTDLSANTFWTESFRDGFGVYSNGITVPISGVYRISYSVASISGVLCGVTINKGAGVALADLNAASTGTLVQGVAVSATSAELKLTAGDVIRLYGIAQGGGATWRTEAGLSLFQATFVRP